MPKSTFLNLPPEKRERIESAAIAEFSANPLPCASINAIVAGAGISKGSFYQYFDGKDDLFAHVLGIVRSRKVELAKSMAPVLNNLDMFAYLRWMFEVMLQFELRQPDLARIERFAFLNGAGSDGDDPDGGLIVGGIAYFNEFLAQGILHDDVATWVDTDLAAFILGTLYHLLGGHLIDQMGGRAEAVRQNGLDPESEPLVRDLFDNLMDILEAGLARDPQIRKTFFNK